MSWSAAGCMEYWTGYWRLRTHCYVGSEKNCSFFALHCFLILSHFAHKTHLISLEYKVSLEQTQSWVVGETGMFCKWWISVLSLGFAVWMLAGCPHMPRDSQDFQVRGGSRNTIWQPCFNMSFMSLHRWRSWTPIQICAQGIKYLQEFRSSAVGKCSSETHSGGEEKMTGV